ncbi:MAG: hypothetical protein A2X22_07960 [Bacteroidetes bacterium GWF2_49_14]|nr:MAG: hypothetical protein A2X22_07960 [Bacteroidetes bacterium GWF2_49_14]HBB91836.1 hypothetical protein [Bacteroidales bacterium]
MNLKRLLATLGFLIGIFSFSFGQERITKSTGKEELVKKETDNKLKQATETVKTVPVTDKNLEAIRLQNRKATMQQMQTINKALRKSMKIHKRR